MLSPANTRTKFAPHRTRLWADPAGVFLHNLVLNGCERFADKTAVVDTSLTPARRLSYAEYGDLVQRLAHGLVRSGLQVGDVVAIFLPNSWEFCTAYHGVSLAGGVPTLLNPTYREREVRYQLQNSDATLLITDGPQIAGMNLGDLPKLRGVYTTRQHAAGTQEFADLLGASRAELPGDDRSPQETLAVLPYSSGTTGLPKGVMLSHANLVTNIYQYLAPDEAATYRADDVLLCFLPLYHIYGLNVVLNPIFATGSTLVLMPRYDEQRLVQLIRDEGVTWMPLVPPAINMLCHVAERGAFPTDHRLRCVKSGAAPLARELAVRFRELTGVPVRQGYGMTEASPVTHIGYMEPELYRPESIGRLVAQTDCKMVGLDECENASEGELVMRGPQFMLGYWKSPGATEAALRDGWYWSGDVARVDQDGFYHILDRRKEMIKYKGFAIAPAEVEAVLLEHPVVRDCGVVGRQDSACGEIPCAFVVLREGCAETNRTAEELAAWVADRLTHYKQPRDVRFVVSIPRNPSGKILRRELRTLL